MSIESVKQKVEDAIAWWSERAEVLIVEGIGGLYCPIAEEATVADLAEALDYPLVIVGRKSLGTLNHVLLTVESARLRGLRIAGVVLNEIEPATGLPAETSNALELATRLAGVAILAELPRRDSGDDPAFIDALRDRLA